MLRCFEGDLGMKIIRRADIDHIDVVCRHEFFPIAFYSLIPPAISEILRLGNVASSNSLEHWVVFEVKEVVHSFVAIGMGTAHKSVTNHADTERF